MDDAVDWFVYSDLSDGIVYLFSGFISHVISPFMIF